MSATLICITADVIANNVSFLSYELFDLKGVLSSHTFKLSIACLFTIY
jgi:hypothetical protein